MPPTPPPQADNTPQMPDIKPSMRERIMGGLGGVLSAGGGQDFGETGLGKALTAYHKRRQDEAAMYWNTASQFYGLSVGAYDSEGNPMTDAKRQEYRNKADAAYEAYAKIAGFSKESKAAIAQAKQRLDQGLPFIQQHIQSQVPDASGAGQPAGGMTPPPATASTTNGAARPTPPPSLSRGDVMAPPSAAHGQALGEEQALLKKQHEYKMEEQQAKPRHMQMKNFKRPGTQEVESGSFDPSDGKFYDQNGDEVPGAVQVASSAMTPKRFLYLEKDKNGKPTIPRFGVQEGENFYDLNHKLLPADITPLMRGLIGTESISTDQFGNRVVTIRHPLTGEEEAFRVDPDTGKMTRVQPSPGGTQSQPAARLTPIGGGTQASPSPSGTPTRPSGAPGGAAPGRTAPPGVTRPRLGRSATPSPAAAGNPYSEWKLDPDGHIPAAPGVNDQVRELANQLLDGADKDKLPTKGRVLAGELARKYGWEQGRFTPKEQVLLRESTTFLEQAMNDEEYLKSFEGGFFSRMKAGQTALSPDKEGYIGRGLSTLAAENLTEREAHSIEVNNQLVGTISGLSQLVRSNRATEATIDRLKAELPNLLTTKDSKHAKARLQRLLNEVNVALKKGTFLGAQQKGGPTPPPSMSTKPSPSSTPSKREEKKVLIEGQDFNVKH